jgi:TonB family protein
LETLTSHQMKSAFLLPLIILAFVSASALPTERPLRVAVLDFGESQTGRRVAERLAQGLVQPPANKTEFQIIDGDRARAAASGIGYQGSVNMTLQEATDLGSAIGCDFFFTGVAQTLRRSPSSGPVYFESYAAIYLVSARTGRLILWERTAVKLPEPKEAEQGLLEKLTAADALSRYQRAIRRALEDERAERAHAIESPAPIIEEAPADTAPIANGLQLPRPYRRLKPPYPQIAAQAEVEATVDALVELDAQGEVGRVEIARWAGYGLDQSVVDTVRQLHFFPAMRDGVATPMRVLLRYNFRKPPQP